MKFFRIDLLTLLISLFILNSCKNQDTIGLTSGSTGELSGSLVDTATIFTNTAAEDSVVTENLAKNAVGFINDPIFGTTEADMATDLNLPFSEAYTKPAGTVIIDSAVLVLKYADGFYGDSTSTYTMNVYQLNERINGSSYLNTKVWNYNAGNLLGTLTFRPYPKDSIKITDIVQGGPDTAIKVQPQIRIPISTTFIRAQVFDAPASQVGSNLIFKNNVKGLFIKVDKSKVSGVGGTMMFSGPADSVAVYIRSSDGTLIDTSIVYLPITRNAVQITRVRSAAVTAALKKDSLNQVNHTHFSDSLVYLQGLAGTRGRISFPYIQNLFKTIGNNNVVINRAELVVTAAPGSDIPAYLTPQPKLSMYRLDIAHQRTYVEDGNSSSAVFQGVGQFGGYYVSPTRNYHFLVTSYIQDLVNNRTIDYGTFIAPVDTLNTTSIDIAATPQTAGRVQVLGGNKGAPLHMKLNVIYTKIGK